MIRKMSLESFEPVGRSACLCGSGERFKNCCKDEYKKHDYRRSLGERDRDIGLRQRLKLLRAHICWYRLCHKSHTSTLLSVDPGKGKELLDIDIKAMASLLNDLEGCYHENGISIKFENALAEVAQAIDHPDWMVEVDIIAALHQMVRFDDRDKARKILSKHDPRVATNSEFIEAYIDAFSNELSHVETINLAERIVALTESDSSRLQYRLVVAIQFFLLNDMVEGEKKALEAVEDYEQIPEVERTIYGRVRLAGAYKNIGELIPSSDYIRKAVDVYVGLVGDSDLNDLGIADVWYCIGDCQLHLKEYKAAEASFRRSLGLFENPIVEIFLARVLIATKRLVDARKILVNVDVSKFCDNNFFDYAVSWCEVAVASQQKSDIDVALENVKKVKTNDPLFMLMHKDLIIQLYESKTNGSGGDVETVLEKINRYLTLNPNVAGIGFNINAMISDMVKRKR